VVSEPIWLNVNFFFSFLSSTIHHQQWLIILPHLHPPLSSLFQTYLHPHPWIPILRTHPVPQPLVLSIFTTYTVTSSLVKIIISGRPQLPLFSKVIPFMALLIAPIRVHLPLSLHPLKLAPPQSLQIPPTWPRTCMINWSLVPSPHP